MNDENTKSSLVIFESNNIDIPLVTLSEFPDVCSKSRAERKNIQYQYLLECAKEISKYIKDNYPPPDYCHFEKKFILSKNIIINNCIKQQEEIPYINNSPKYCDNMRDCICETNKRPYRFRSRKQNIGWYRYCEKREMSLFRFNLDGEYGYLVFLGWYLFGIYEFNCIFWRSKYWWNPTD